MKPEVDWRKRGRRTLQMDENSHRWMVLIMSFPMVGGTPRGSS
jgi:hypothetical protein